MVEYSALDIRKKRIRTMKGRGEKACACTIVYLGKQGLSFRGYRHEAAHAPKDNNINHGNVLELVKLGNKSQNSFKTSKRRKDNGKIVGSYGHGSFVTFFSHDITTRITQIIRDLLHESIAEEVKLAGMFSVEMDTIQDVTTQDQGSMVLRYMTDMFRSGFYLSSNQRLALELLCYLFPRIP